MRLLSFPINAITTSSDVPIYREPINPTIDVNPPKKGALWINYESGEIFICKCNTPGKNFWIGNKGTIIAPSTVSKFDIFGDGSAVALYRFEENANDDGGQYNGIWYGSEQYDVGKFGQAAKFDGNSYIEVPSPLNVSPVLAISFWIKFPPIDTSSKYCIFHFSKDGSNTFSLWLYDSGGGCKFEVIANDTVYCGASVPEPNTWHHVILTTQGKVYVDRELVAKFDFDVDAASFNKNAIIGGDRDGDSINDYLQSGTLIDQFRIFNREPTSEEVEILYNEWEVC